MAKPAAPAPSLLQSLPQSSYDASRGSTDLKSLKDALASSVLRSRAEIARGERALEGLRVEMATREQAAASAQLRVESLNQQYLFFQSARDKLSYMLDCLREKTGMIDEAWTELRELFSAYRVRVREDTNLHLSDCVAEAWGEPVASGPPILDDFGRDVAEEAKHGRLGRAKARARRAQAAAAAGMPDGWESEEGEASALLQQQRRDLLADADLIFEDVTDEFANFDSLQELLQTWKDTYRTAYEDAYIAMTFPSVLAPYIRLALLYWDPLASPTLDGMVWYGKLFSYGVGGAEAAEGDLDNKLIPRLVDKLVIPVAVAYLSHVYDVFSPRQLGSAVACVKEIWAHLAEDATLRSDLNSAIVSRISSEVNELARFPRVPGPRDVPFPTVRAGSADEEAERGQRQEAFCQKQWWRGAKLLAHIQVFFLV